MSKPIIVVTGDLDSVFFEIFFKSLKKKKIKSPIILICNVENYKLEKTKYKFKGIEKEYTLKQIFKKNLNPKTIYLYDIELSKDQKQYLDKSFKIAFELIKKGISNKLINGPINKKNFLNNKFLGITEYISKSFQIKKTGMLIYNKKISVCPVTTHLPLKNVSHSISKSLIQEKINLVNNFYFKYLKAKPRIAVTGLNPHCESILKFNEDEKIIKPAIQAMKKRNINVKGPFPADTIFSSKNRQLFDVVIGMYHDQVLAPIKALFEFDAVNITMGLSFLRASPDHGPNKEMASKNKSNPTSLIRALEFLDKR